MASRRLRFPSKTLLSLFRCSFLTAPTPLSAQISAFESTASKYEDYVKAATTYTERRNLGGQFYDLIYCTSYIDNGTFTRGHRTEIIKDEGRGMLRYTPEQVEALRPVKWENGEFPEGEYQAFWVWLKEGWGVRV